MKGFHSVPFSRDLFPLLLAIGLTGPMSLSSEEWPSYRGPSDNGVATETIRTNWSQQTPATVWRVRLDPGLSSFAISGRRAYTQVNRPRGREQTEFCVALDADSGRELWAVPLDLAQYDGGVGPDDGPRSTPAVDADRVFVVTSYLWLACLDSATGTILWRKDLKEVFQGRSIPWQNAASPLVEGDLVILNCNAQDGQCLLAANKATGETVWRRHNDRLTHATPVRAVIGGVRQVIFLAQSGLVAVLPADGTVLWRAPLVYNGISVAASPVVSGDLIYVSRAYPGSLSAPQAGAVVVRVTETAGKFSASEVWSTPNRFMNHWATPVAVGGHLYGLYGQGDLKLKCIEFATGRERWSQDGFGYGSVVVVNEKVLACSDTGQLVLIEPTPDAYTPIERFRPLTGKCWNVPALSNGRLYVRSTTEAVCLDVSLPRPATRLRIFTPALAPNGAFEISLGGEDGAPIDSSRLAKIALFTAFDLGVDLNNWSRVTSGSSLSNGVLRFEPFPPAARQFFRAVEEP